MNNNKIKVNVALNKKTITNKQNEIYINQIKINVTKTNSKILTNKNEI